MKKRVFSGMRHTGRLHLGHLVGALENWVAMQEEYDCIFGIVDWHALTSEYQNVNEIRPSVFDIAIVNKDDILQAVTRHIAPFDTRVGEIDVRKRVDVPTLDPVSIVPPLFGVVVETFQPSAGADHISHAVTGLYLPGLHGGVGILDRG